MITGIITKIHMIFIAITIATPLSKINSWTRVFMAKGTLTSTLLMSFENLLKIMPEGVTSKYKFMGAPQIFSSIFLKRLAEIDSPNAMLEAVKIQVSIAEAIIAQVTVTNS
mmetsp:Transcript_7536/g.7082  ORF Transcript_7536/g.7082 Transcript_7536/m.7082 type:complete len:111 (+) Transcript_7536:182-514(+)